MTEQNVPPGNGVIVAKAYRNFRLTRYALVLFMFGYGLMSLYDGFYRYPRENDEDRRKGIEENHVRHHALDVPFNKAFGIALPPLALALLAWALYSSRGEFRFDGTTLIAPGHPPVPVTAITQIDRSLWDRKSIAYIHYTLPDSGASGKIKIDHSRYDPIDKLFKQVQLAVEGEPEPALGTSPPATATRPNV